jgi:catechol 2,3-dioxygenase-like lactoylglutathione lyase family enzyme
MTGCYPVLMTADVTRAADFFRDHFDFRPTFENDWYVSLAHAAGELAVLDPTHSTVPHGYGTTVSGMLINIEVDNVDDVYQRLVVDGPLDAVLELRSEAFGQRHFIVRGPEASLVDVITEIPPEGEYVDAYA